MVCYNVLVTGCCECSLNTLLNLSKFDSSLLHHCGWSTLSGNKMQSVLRPQIKAVASLCPTHRQSSSCLTQRTGSQRAVPAAAAAPAVSRTETELPKDIKSVLFSEQEVRLKVAELAREICRTHKGKKVAIIGVLNGAFIFTSGDCNCLRSAEARHAHSQAPAALLLSAASSWT